MTKTRHFLRSVSIVLLQSFILQQASFADMVSPSKADPLSKPMVSLDLPETVASIEDAYKSTVHRPQSTERMIYLLQDAHTNESAQYNLAKTLDIILKKEARRGPSTMDHGLKYVFTEAGIGDNSLSFLRPFRPLAERVQLAKSYTKKGILHGAEYLDLTSDHSFILWGVENPELYLKAIQDYKHVAKERDRFEIYLKKIAATLDTLNNRLLNPALQEFLKESKLYHQDKLALTEYFQALQREATLHNLDLKKYPHLNKLKDLKAQEEKIDFQKANEEHLKAVQSLPQDIQQELKELSQVKAGKILQNKKEERAYFAYLEEKLDVNYPELTKYFEYLKSAKDIQAKDILSELKAFEQEVFRTLAKTEDEKSLIKAEETLRYLNKLFSFTLTPEEFKAQDFNIEHLTGFLNKKILDLETYYERSLFLEKGYEEMIQKAQSFYQLTFERDEYFLDQALTKMDQENQTKAALITGGFHTTNLKELLKKKNISYISITPQVLQETNLKKYESLLLNQIQDLKTTQLTLKPAVSTAMTAMLLSPALGNAVLSQRAITDFANGASLSTVHSPQTTAINSLPSTGEAAGARLTSALSKIVQLITSLLIFLGSGFYFIQSLDPFGDRDRTFLRGVVFVALFFITPISALVTFFLFESILKSVKDYYEQKRIDIELALKGVVDAGEPVIRTMSDSKILEHKLVAAGLTPREVSTAIDYSVRDVMTKWLGLGLDANELRQRILVLELLKSKLYAWMNSDFKAMPLTRELAIVSGGRSIAEGRANGGFMLKMLEKYEEAWAIIASGNQLEVRFHYVPLEGHWVNVGEEKWGGFGESGPYSPFYDQEFQVTKPGEYDVFFEAKLTDTSSQSSADETAKVELHEEANPIASSTRDTVESAERLAYAAIDRAIYNEEFPKIVGNTNRYTGLVRMELDGANFAEGVLQFYDEDKIIVSGTAIQRSQIRLLQAQRYNDPALPYQGFSSNGARLADQKVTLEEFAVLVQQQVVKQGDAIAIQLRSGENIGPVMFFSAALPSELVYEVYNEEEQMTEFPSVSLKDIDHIVIKAAGARLGEPSVAEREIIARNLDAIADRVIAEDPKASANKEKPRLVAGSLKVFANDIRRYPTSPDKNLIIVTLERFAERFEDERTRTALLAEAESLRSGARLAYTPIDRAIYNQELPKIVGNTNRYTGFVQVDADGRPLIEGVLEYYDADKIIVSGTAIQRSQIRLLQAQRYRDAALPYQGTPINGARLADEAEADFVTDWSIPSTAQIRRSSIMSSLQARVDAVLRQLDRSPEDASMLRELADTRAIIDALHQASGARLAGEGAPASLANRNTQAWNNVLSDVFKTIYGFSPPITTDTPVAELLEARRDALAAHIAQVLDERTAPRSTFQDWVKKIRAAYITPYEKFINDGKKITTIPADLNEEIIDMLRRIDRARTDAAMGSRLSSSRALLQAIEKEGFDRDVLPTHSPLRETMYWLAQEPSLVRLNINYVTDKYRKAAAELHTLAQTGLADRLEALADELKSTSGARLAEISPELADMGIRTKSVQVSKLIGTGDESTVLQKADVRYSVGTTVSATIAALPFVGVVDSKSKDYADGAAVEFVHRSALGYTSQNMGEALVSSASEGKRDGSFYIPIGRIYWSGYERGWRDFMKDDTTFDRAAFEAEVGRLRDINIVLRSIRNDAVERTVGTTDKEGTPVADNTDFDELINTATDSNSFSALIDGPIQLIDDNTRVMGIAANSPGVLEISPLSLPRDILRKLAELKGFNADNESELNTFISGFRLFSLGPRPDEKDGYGGKEIRENRHGYIIVDADQLSKSIKGFSYATSGDGNFLPALIALIGLDFRNKQMIVANRFGSAEGHTLAVAAANIQGAQFTYFEVSLLRTNKAFDPKVAQDFTDEEQAIYAEFGSDIDAAKALKNAGTVAAQKGLGIVSVTSLSGASKKVYGEASEFPALFHRPWVKTTTGKSAEITTNTLVVDRDGSVYLVRVVFETDNLKIARERLKYASYAGRRFFGSQIAWSGQVRAAWDRFLPLDEAFTKGNDSVEPQLTLARNDLITHLLRERTSLIARQAILRSDAGQPEIEAIEALLANFDQGARLAMSPQLRHFLISQKIIAFVAPPWAGKGTQLAWLKEQLGFETLEMGVFVRGALNYRSGTIADKNPMLEEFRLMSEVIPEEEYALMAKGRLMSDETALKIVNLALSWPRYQKASGIIMDGFPRNLEQMRMINDGQVLWNGQPLKVDLFVGMDVPDETLRERSAYARGDRPDNGKTDSRLQEFREQTLPLMDHLRTAKNAVFFDADNRPGTQEESILAVRNESMIPALQAYADRMSHSARVAWVTNDAPIKRVGARLAEEEDVEPSTVHSPQSTEIEPDTKKARAVLTREDRNTKQARADLRRSAERRAPRGARLAASEIFGISTEFPFQASFTEALEAMLVGTAQAQSIGTSVNEISILLDPSQATIFELSLKGNELIVNQRGGKKLGVLNVSSVDRNDKGIATSVKVGVAEALSLINLNTQSVQAALGPLANLETITPTLVVTHLEQFGDIKADPLALDVFILKAAELANKPSNPDALRFSLFSTDPSLASVAEARLQALEAKHSFVRGKFVRSVFLAGYVAVNSLIPGHTVAQAGQRVLPVQALETGDVANPNVQILLAVAIAQQEAGQPVSDHLVRGFEAATGVDADPKELQAVIFTGTDQSLLQKYAIKPVLQKIGEYLQVLRMQMKQVAQAA